VAFPSDPDFLVLHALRLKGFAEAGVNDPAAYIHPPNAARR
jgi:hypothetical protein